MNTLPAIGDDISISVLSPPSLAGPGDSVALLQFPSQAGFQESTLLRIRGSLMFPKSEITSGVDSAISYAFGIGIVSDQSAEALAVPNPATATGYDWDGWLFLRNAFSAPLEPTAEIVDVKAMRKWKSGDSIVIVAGLATNVAAGEATIPFKFSLRGLFLLP